MHRMCTAIALLACAAAAFTDLQVNPDTVILGDEFIVSGTCSDTGVAVAVTVFLDVNQNDVYDEGVDCMTMDGRTDSLVDGDGEPDPDLDGRLSFDVQTTQDPIPFAGTYVSYYADAGGADTVRLVVREVATQLAISGTLTGPSGPLAGVPVGLEMAYCDYADNCDDGERMVLTDGQGRYTIYLPDTVAELEVEIGPVNEYGRVDTTLAWPGSEQFYGTASLTDVDFVFVTATQFIRITVQDENGAPVDSAEIEIDGPWFCEHVYTTNAQGVILVPATPDWYSITYQSHPSRYYMAEMGGFSVSLEQQAILDTTLVLLSATSSVSGTIDDQTANAFPLQEIEVVAWGSVNPGPTYETRVWVEPDGSFEIPVNQNHTYLGVAFEAEGEELAGYYIEHGVQLSIQPGATDLSATVHRCEGEISGTISTGDSSLFDEAGIAVMRQDTGATLVHVTEVWASDDGDFNLPLPNGTYTVIVNYHTTEPESGRFVTIENVVINNGNVLLSIVGSNGEIASVLPRISGHRPAEVRLLPGREPVVGLSLDRRSHVEFVIHDIQGRRVGLAYSGFLGEGQHHVRLAPSMSGQGTASLLYVLRVRVKQAQASRVYHVPFCLVR